MSNPKYKSGATWFDIPDAAIYGTHGGTWSIEYPPATEIGVDGTPCGAVGRPRIIIRTAWMQETGLAFWRAFFATVDDTYASINIEAWDSRAGATVKWAGNLRWPTWDSVGVGGTDATTIYRNVTIEINECVTTS